MPKQNAKKPVRKTHPISRRTSRNRSRILKFLPALLIIGTTIFVGSEPTIIRKSDSSVLSYATSVAISDLLSHTNAQRSSSGIANLGLNSLLNSAAQAKANDMTARNYWSHTTPDGIQPWTFITNAGYQYTAAGENLAYGFMTSAETVTGWMNSPPHKANILNGTYTEVGFGIANSPNFNGAGEQTVVVAMYAAPQAVQPATAAARKPTGPTQPSASPAPEQIAEEPVPDILPAETETEVIQSTSEPLSAGTKIQTAAASKPVRVRKVQILTNGQAAWSATAIVASVCAIGILWTLQHGLKIKRLMLAGERYFIHHIHMDLTIAAVIALGIVLLSTTGVIH